MLDADDGAAVGADEMVEHTREIARASADVEDARTGAQVWKEELSGMGMLFTRSCVQVRSDELHGAVFALLARGWMERGGTYHVWRRDGRIVADRSNMCESVRRQDGATGTYWGESS